MAGSASRTSARAFTRASAIAVRGLAPRRSKRAHQARHAGSFGRPGEKERREAPLPPLGADPGDELLEPLGRQHRGMEVRERAVQDERAHACRVGGGEQQAGRPALGAAEQDRTLHSGGVHHRPQAVHPRLDRRQVRNGVGEAGAALVELATRAKPPRRDRGWASPGSSQCSSRFETKPWTRTRSSGPAPWTCQAMCAPSAPRA
jgi:hypothetical protein